MSCQPFWIDVILVLRRLNLELHLLQGLKFDFDGLKNIQKELALVTRKCCTKYVLKSHAQ